MSDTPADWPLALREHLTFRFGAIGEVAPLRGLSHNRVWLAGLEREQVVVKHALDAREAQFYRTIRPLLDPHCAFTPQLHWGGADEDGAWLALEYIPQPLPRERWGADPDAVAALRRVHEAALPLEASAWFRPAWTPAMSAQALALCGAAADGLQPALRELEQQCQALLAGRCPISGDPNPRNWGVRADGRVVLFDWERFGLGTPALDLAILVPGLGEQASFHAIAEAYLRDRSHSPADIIGLARQVALAKVWNAVEFLSMASEGGVGDTSSVAWLTERFPPWLTAQVLPLLS